MATHVNRQLLVSCTCIIKAIISLSSYITEKAVYLAIANYALCIRNSHAGVITVSRRNSPNCSRYCMHGY